MNYLKGDKMKAFIGRSFKDEDAELVSQIAEFIESQGIDCGDAKSAKSRKVEEKIRELISGCDIFVGVFTRDEAICKKEKKTKWYCRPRSENTIYTGSNWVIQESGFAIGKDKELILLKEDGVRDLPKLQGNLEYIPFNRRNLQEPFLKMSQMISDMKGSASGGASEKPSEELTVGDETKLEEREDKPKEKPKDGKGEVLEKIRDALFGDENYIEAQKIFDDEAEAVLDEDEKAPTQATILRFSHQLGQKSAFGKLQTLVQENKGKPRVIKQLAHRYKEMGEFEKAKEQFLLAAEKYDVNDAERKWGLVDAHVQAAWCTAEDDLDGALSMLQKLLFNPNFQDSKAKIFKGMAEICKDKDDMKRFFIYAEAALDVDPCDTDLRFTLAYAYSQNKDENLSLLHYKKLIDTTTNGTALNNLGVQYDALKLSYKCVESYYKSADQNKTLAMANLAQKYLNEGFIKNASELVDRANKLSNEGVKVDYRVGKAQERINNLTEEESKKERAILAEAEKERKFRVDYSKAFCSDRTVAKGDIEGVWETPWGNLKLVFDGTAGSFRMSGIKQVEIGQLAAALLTPSQPKLEKQFKNQTIEITGTIEHMSGKYSITVKDEGRTTLLTGGKIHEATAYMVISESCNCIEIMEKTSDNKTEYKQWKKHEEKIKKE